MAEARKRSKLQVKIEGIDSRAVVKLKPNNLELDSINVERILAPQAVRLGIYQRVGELDLVRNRSLVFDDILVRRISIKVTNHAFLALPG
jgi:hypothetical protein